MTLQKTKYKEIEANVFSVTAKHIEGTRLCSVELPCKYKNKSLTVVVFEEGK